MRCRCFWIITVALPSVVVALFVMGAVPFYTTEDKVQTFDFHTGPMPTFRLPEDVRLSELESTTFQILDRTSRGHGFTREHLQFEELRFAERPSERLVRYRLLKCVRIRFDWRRCAFAADYSDPVAASRNQAVQQAVAEAVRSCNERSSAGQESSAADSS